MPPRIWNFVHQDAHIVGRIWIDDRFAPEASVVAKQPPARRNADDERCAVSINRRVYRRLPTAPAVSPPLVEGPVPLRDVGPPAVPLAPP